MKRKSLLLTNKVSSMQSGLADLAITRLTFCSSQTQVFFGFLFLFKTHHWNQFWSIRHHCNFTFKNAEREEARKRSPRYWIKWHEPFPKCFPAKQQYTCWFHRPLEEKIRSLGGIWIGPVGLTFLSKVCYSMKVSLLPEPSLTPKALRNAQYVQNASVCISDFIVISSSVFHTSESI